MSTEGLNTENLIKELTKELKDYKHNYKMYVGILAVKMVKKENPEVK